MAIAVLVPRDERKRDFVHNTLNAAPPVSAWSHLANKHTSRSAQPTWDDLSTADHDTHRAECPDLCRFCGDHRAWGHCVSCGYTREATDAGVCVCGGPLLIGADIHDGPEFWSEG